MILATQNQDYDHLAKEHGVTLIKEAFIDRRYLSSGLLSPRTMADSVMHEWDEIKHQVEAMLHDRSFKSIEGDEIKLQADTLCVHGDNPIAVEITTKVRALSMELDP
ncbi:lactam utilization protein LamB [Vibrio sp. JCM 19236]|nr:lactam utilization protein LamB [Vibrio sp. JCM 19236]